MERLRAAGIGPELVPGGLAIATFLVWAALEGGFEPVTWYPGALWLLGLLAVAVATAWRSGVAVPKATRIAIGAGLAFAVWAFASIAWSDARGDAWDGANQTLLYVSVFAAFGLLAWRPAGGATALGAYSVGIAGLALGTLLHVAGSGEPELYFIKSRLAEPVGYHNANAALYIAAAFPALALCSRREVPWIARGLLAGCAAVLIEVALLSQSRGSLISLPLAFALYIAIVPGRARTIAAAGLVAIPVAIAAPTLLDVYTALEDGSGVKAGLENARAAVLLSLAGLVLAGTAIAFGDRNFEASQATARAGRVTAFAAGTAVGVAAVVAALIAIGNPVGWAEDRWDDFKHGDAPTGAGSRLTSGLGSNRYDFYRVALDSWADEPVTGIGTRQFGAAYLVDRRSPEEPTYAHSLSLEILTETGLVGTLLFGTFLAAGVLAAVRARAALAGEFGRVVIGAALVAAAYWLIHGQVDWLAAFPALSAPAFAWLAMAGRIEGERPTDDAAAADREHDGSRGRMGRIGPAAALIAVAIAFAAAAASYLLPWGAARDVEAATEIWPTAPAAAYDRLERAGDLQFLGERPALIEGAIAVRLGDFEHARAAFEEAISRNAANWYAQFELGALDAVEGDRRGALEHLRLAAELNPDEPLIASVLEGARSGEPLAMAEIDRMFLERVCARVGRTTDTRYCK